MAIVTVVDSMIVGLIVRTRIVIDPVGVVIGAITVIIGVVAVVGTINGLAVTVMGLVATGTVIVTIFDRATRWRSSLTNRYQNQLQ